MNTAPNVKGIRIRTVNLAMLGLSIFLFLLIFWMTFRIYRDYSRSVEATRDYLLWEKAAHEIHEASELLTDSARLYVQTGRKQHAEEYFRELDGRQTREKAIEYARTNTHTPEADCSLESALQLSNALSHREIYAMRLMAEASGAPLEEMPDRLRNIELEPEDQVASAGTRMQTARDLLFSISYHDSKTQILGILDQCLQKNMALTGASQRENLARLGTVLDWQRIALIALFILCLLTYAMIIVLIVRPLQIYMKCIENDRTIEVVGAYEFRHLALVYNDIFAIREHHERMLKHKADHDALTGLLNRRAYDSLTSMLASDNEPVGLVMIDVDHFKDINDTLGHEAGDQALCLVASLLQRSFRSDDFCIRFGGDEFAVIVRRIPPSIHDILRNKINDINEELSHPADGLTAFSISAGVAISQFGFTEQLYHRADLALYYIKEHGRRGCAFYSELPQEAKNANK